MRERHPLWSTLLVVMASLLLVSCGSDEPAKQDEAKAEEKAAEHKDAASSLTPICPQVAVVRGLDVVRDYGGENPDPKQLVTAAKLLGIEGDCEYTDEGVDVAFHLNMAALRGPRLGGLQTSFPVFIAVLDPGGDVLNKNQITVGFSFASDSETVNRAEALHVFIPLPRDKRVTGPSYKILSGFQLTPTQEAEMKAAAHEN